MNFSKSKFYFLESIVVQGYIARVLVLFYTVMRRRGYLIDIRDVSLERLKGFNTIIDVFDFVVYL